MLQAIHSYECPAVTPCRTLSIEKNVPIPERRVFQPGAKSKVLRQMQKGDSVLVVETAKTERQRWRTAAAYIGFRIITRKEGNGFRLWRGEDI